MQQTKMVWVAVILFLAWPLSVTAGSGSTVSTDINVIHASTLSGGSDPGLEHIIHELNSVFKYTSYKLITSRRLMLNENQEGLVPLPDRKMLSVYPIHSDGPRIHYQITITKSGQTIFQTQVMLKNSSSLTIGGPQLDKGVLLINITGTKHD